MDLIKQLDILNLYETHVHPMVAETDPNAVVNDPFWDDVFAEKNFQPIPMGSYTNTMFITLLVFAAAYVLLIPSLIVFFPCALVMGAWLALLYGTYYFFTNSPQTLGNFFVEWIVSPVEWFFMSIIVYAARAVEYGILIGIAEATGADESK